MTRPSRNTRSMTRTLWSSCHQRFGGCTAFWCLDVVTRLHHKVCFQFYWRRSPARRLHHRLLPPQLPAQRLLRQQRPILHPPQCVLQMTNQRSDRLEQLPTLTGTNETISILNLFLKGFANECFLFFLCVCFFAPLQKLGRLNKLEPLWRSTFKFG